MPEHFSIPGLGLPGAACGLLPLAQSSDQHHFAGRDGVREIWCTVDGKIEFLAYDQHTLAYVRSALGYPAYYPLREAAVERPVRAVLMDLDGTSVHSEAFWIWIIEQCVASLRGEATFRLAPEDAPYVSGHSVSEHLQYAINRYCPGRSVEEARRWYFEHTRRELAEILAGRGRTDAFRPSPGLRAFLSALKSAGVRIGLVTSGLHEKAWPAIVAAFREMQLGDPLAFYDAIITAGFPLHPGAAGTLGELCPKPHPWLYAECARVGLGIPPEERHRVIGIEDSAAGVCAIRLAGFAAFGVEGGNIRAAGAAGLCHAVADSFEAILSQII